METTLAYKNLKEELVFHVLAYRNNSITEEDLVQAVIEIYEYYCK